MICRPGRVFLAVTLLLNVRSNETENPTLDAGQLDPAEVAAWYATHAAELRAFLMGVLRDAEWASEALQSTFVKAAAAGHTAQRDTIKGWLFRVAYNEAMLLKRRQAVDQRATRQVAWQISPTDLQSEAADAGLLKQELIDSVRRGLETLSAAQRTVVRLRIYEDKTFAEIAAKLNVPLGTVVTRMRAALQKLNRELKEPDA